MGSQSSKTEQQTSSQSQSTETKMDEKKETKEKQLTCYACGTTKAESDFRFECMCTERKGICKGCIDSNKPQNEWLETPNKHHKLQRLHDFTPEYKEWSKKLWDTMEELGSSSLTIRDDKITIHYYESPEAAGKKLGNDAWMISDTEITGKDETEREERRKREVDFPPPPLKHCTCC